jgi:hypothetical protein
MAASGGLYLLALVAEFIFLTIYFRKRDQKDRHRHQPLERYESPDRQPHPSAHPVSYKTETRSKKIPRTKRADVA